ncbi:hypothetical protein SLEP1_g19957 [Rubroshorea leprosula]|uniref:Uncharacterized protein n=1 Tax=Rubroshorea leprosula TaxID=152421 RepID=A0AAV5J118_9ROSI|nr:hypothetical protein SLEP1_g19957 [Rubroshorea leprosula]
MQRMADFTDGFHVTYSSQKNNNTRDEVMKQNNEINLSWHDTSTKY